MIKRNTIISFYELLDSDFMVVINGLRGENKMIEKNIVVVYDGSNFGEFIRNLRIYLGYTQEEFSEKVLYEGLSYSSLRNFEQGKTEPKYPIDLIDRVIESFREDIERKCIKVVIDLER